MPNYGLVVEYDLNGRVVRSWHDPEGKHIKSVSCVTQNNGKLYLGTFEKDHVAILDY
jgi:hypothetical protein